MNDDITRRDALKRIAATSAVAATVSACAKTDDSISRANMPTTAATGEPKDNPMVRTLPLGFPWQTIDPFLFCVHHDDHYPAGNAQMGPPSASLAGRNLGMDFDIKDGWRMYHGRVVPGFPQHPHRGFETVTVVRKGMLDHSDSLGARARYGGGDVQWLTAGAGIIHAEMFPLLHQDRDNPVELFQIWLNLPSRDKFAEPHFTMLWNETIPRVTFEDDRGKKTLVTLEAGRLGDAVPPAPPPRSWASQADSDVAIWTIAMTAGARWTLPPAKPGTRRMLYFFEGSALTLDGHALSPDHGAELVADRPVELHAGQDEVEVLLLQGRPIGEPVAQYGPFVMNTREEIQQAFADYRKTQFGGWRWGRDDPVHAREAGRFAERPDGTVERPA